MDILVLVAKQNVVSMLYKVNCEDNFQKITMPL
jgi:hypothetical protein